MQIMPLTRDHISATCWHSLREAEASCCKAQSGGSQHARCPLPKCFLSGPQGPGSPPRAVGSVLVWGQQESGLKPPGSLPKDVLGPSPLNRTEVCCLRHFIVTTRQSLPWTAPACLAPSLPCRSARAAPSSPEQMWGASPCMCHLYPPDPPRPAPYSALSPGIPSPNMGRTRSKTVSALLPCENELLEDRALPGLFLDSHSSAKGPLGQLLLHPSLPQVCMWVNEWRNNDDSVQVSS